MTGNTNDTVDAARIADDFVAYDLCGDMVDNAVQTSLGYIEAIAEAHGNIQSDAVLDGPDQVGSLEHSLVSKVDVGTQTSPSVRAAPRRCRVNGRATQCSLASQHPDCASVASQTSHDENQSMLQYMLKRANFNNAELAELRRRSAPHG